MRKLLLTTMMALTLAACTGGVVDPTKVQADIKGACGILVVAANIAEILKIDPTMSASAIVNLVCTGLQTASQPVPPPTALLAQPQSNEVTFPVVVKGQTVVVHATKP